MSENGKSKTPAPLWLLLLAVTVIGILAMPREEYSGDARVVRCVTVALINYQDLDVPARLAHSLEAGSGNYFFENKSSHKFFCKYGILNTLLYVPPLLLQKWHDGKLEYFSDTRAIYLNWFNIILTIGSAWYLYLIASRYTAFRSLAVVFVLTAFYTTFWWNYLRAQSYEIYQVLLLLGFYYHFTSSLMLSAAGSGGEAQSERRRDLFLAGVWFGALFLVKTVNVLMIPVVLLVFVVAWLIRPTGYPVLLRRAAWFGLPVLCALCALFAANAYQYGSPFESGYSQGYPVFAGGSIPTGLRGYLFESDHSIFIYFPIFAFALFGYPKFFKRYPLDALIFSSIGLLMLLVNSRLGDWRGGWGYGSRYLLPYLPLASLPFLKTMEFLLENWRKWLVSGCAALMVAALGWSFHSQLAVNGFPFFGYYKLESFFLGFHMPEVDRYFRSHTFAEVDADLVAYKHGKPWQVMELMEPVLNAQGIDAAKATVRRYTASNYYFWPDPPQSH